MGVLPMAELANCARCDAVFVKTSRDICTECYREEEQAFQKVYRFLSKRENREATIAEIVKATGVEEELIIKFIRNNRLQRSRFPKLAYPCERCGIDIVTGRFCEECSEKLISEFEAQEKLEERQSKQKEKRRKIDTYYSFDKNSFK